MPEPIIFILGKIFLCLLICYLAALFLNSIKALNSIKLFDSVSYAISAIFIAIIHLLNADTNVVLQCIVILIPFSVLLLHNTFSWLFNIKAKISENHYDTLKNRYTLNFALCVSIKIVWNHPYLISIFLTSFVVVYIFNYIFSLYPYSLSTKSKIINVIQHFLTYENNSYYQLIVIICLQSAYFGPQINSYVFLDLNIFIILLSLYHYIDSSKIILISLKYNFDVWESDVHKLVKDWNKSITPEHQASLFMSLDRKRKLSKTMRQKIIDIGSKKTKLMTGSFISMILNGDLRFRDGISEANIQRVLKHCQNEVNNMGIAELVNLSNLTNEYSEPLFRVSLKHFEIPYLDINERLHVSNILKKQISLNPCHTLRDDADIVNSLKKVALEEKGIPIPNKELLLRLIAFQCLKLISTELSEEFYKKYYLNNIRHNLQSGWTWSTCPMKCEFSSKAQALANFEHYLAINSVNNKNVFSLLETMSLILCHKYSMDTSIFMAFHEKEWHKELLIYLLLGKAAEVDELGWNEIKVKQFMEQIELLKSFVHVHCTDIDDGISKTEGLLKAIINKQNEYKFNVSQIINILIVVQARFSNVDIILNSENNNFIQELVDMEFVWLCKLCNDRNILGNINSKEAHGDPKLQELHQMLEGYNISTINIIFNKIPKNTNSSDLISFFKMLNNSFLSDDCINEFLEVLNSDSLYAWKLQLCHLIAREVITFEFPNYARDICKEITFSHTTNKLLDKIKNTLNNTFDNIKRNHDKFTHYKQHRKGELNDVLIQKTDSSLKLMTALLDLEGKLAKLLCLDCWSIVNLAPWIHCLDSLQKIQAFANTIEIITEYNLKYENTLNDILDKSTSKCMESNVFQYALVQNFSGTYEKSFDLLLRELNHLNQTKNNNYVQGIALEKAYTDVLNSYNTTSALTNGNKCMREWDAFEINVWAKNFKNSTTSTVSESEKIAVLKRAMELSLQLELRSIQLMSVLIMVNTEKEKGRLAQINTGEGKTAIIAMIAAYHALHNHKVDIVTTSPVLAIPQSEQQKPFFSMLNLSVAHNVRNQSGYLADICYGPAIDFQADVLRDECRKSGIRHGRNYDVVIVDEVDSMFIDGNNHIVKLSSDMPGMNNLETLIAAITIQIDYVASCVQEGNDGKYYYLQSECRINEDGTVNAEEVTPFPLNCSIEKFIKDSTESHIRKLVRDTKNVDKNYPIVEIPNHLREFVCKIQIPKWIDSAIKAKYRFEDTKHYLLKEGKIMPVDALNTGVVQENQNWSNGLHQFLQIKHGDSSKLQPESLTNNYISNIGFFKRYGNHIYGLTGTLGDAKSTEFLENIYEVDTVIVPPFKKKQHIELIPTIFDSEKEWYSNIVKNCINKLKCGRAVLVITKYIKEIDQIFTLFCENYYDKDKIILFKTNEDVRLIEKVIRPGEVIITTNIAGRGTDIKLDSCINENGGLHVCLTFLPINTRVEEQNFGRTSRTGNPGTSQLMICQKNITDMVTLKNGRDKNQKNIIAQAQSDSYIVLSKEIIFKEFLNLLETIKGRNNFKHEVLVAIEERFALWLKQYEDFINKEIRRITLSRFEDFKNNIFEDERQSKLIRNPYFHVIIGRGLMRENKFSDAINEFTSAIKLDQHFAEHAFYNRGYCLLAKYGKYLKRNKAHIDDAIGDLQQARKLIQKRETDLHLIQRASNAEVFSNQMQHKINLLNIQKQAIDLAIGPDKDEIKEQIKILTNRKLEIPKENEEDIKKITNIIKTFEKNEKEKGTIEIARDKERNIEIKPMNISDCLPVEEIGIYNDEIDELNRNGFIGGFKVSEIKPIDWKAVFGLMVLGLGQLIAGAALAIYTLGSGVNLAMSLISEGISDIITAIKDGIINRDFSWATWAIQKAVSIVVSVVCAGMSAVKDVAKTACAGANILGRNVINQTVKSGWILVAKKIGTELAKGIAKEIVSDLANYGVEVTLIPKIQEKIIELIEGPIKDALTNNTNVKKMLEIDLKNENNNYERFITSEALKILTTPICNTTLLSVGKQIALGIGDGKIKYFSAGRKFAIAIQALNELRTFVPEFIKELNKSIENKVNLDKIMLTESDRKQESVKAYTEDNTDTVEIATQQEPPITHFDDDIDLKKGQNRQKKSENKRSKKKMDVSRISKQVTNWVSDSMLSKIKGSMVNPLMQAGITYSMDKISKSLTSTLDNEIENYRSVKRVIHDQNKGYIGQSNNINQTPDALSVDAIEKADLIIQEAMSGDKCGLPHLGAISDVTGQPIQVYDENGDLKFTIGDTKSEAPLKVQHHKDTEHYTVLGNMEPSAQGTDTNMCLFNVISDQINVDPDVLKSQTIQWMEHNKLTLAKQSADITRLQMYDSIKLCFGGAQYTGKNKDDAAKYLNASNKTFGYKIGKVSHVRGHASDPTKTDLYESVENYSTTDPVNGKTGFKSYEDQDYVAHYALIHKKTQKAMNKLNSADGTWGSQRQIVHLTAAELNLPMPVMAGKWINKTQIGPDFAFSKVVLVIQNEATGYGDKNAPVHIQTIYLQK